MRSCLVSCLLVCAAATPARAGKYFDPGAGLPSRTTFADCGRGRWPAGDRIPAWSRLHWSVEAGAVISDGRAAAVIVPELGIALWAKDWQCASGSGLFADHLWQRWSLSLTGDAAFRSGTGSGEGGVDVRPALRLARSHARRGLLSAGTQWVPSTELFVSLGPTFDPAFSGAAVGLGGRVSIVALELRLAARTGDRGHEFALLLGLTDLHGLWKLGRPRTISYAAPAS